MTSRVLVRLGLLALLAAAPVRAQDDPPFAGGNASIVTLPSPLRSPRRTPAEGGRVAVTFTVPFAANQPFVVMPRDLDRARAASLSARLTGAAGYAFPSEGTASVLIMRVPAVGTYELHLESDSVETGDLAVASFETKASGYDNVTLAGGVALPATGERSALARARAFRIAVDDSPLLLSMQTRTRLSGAWILSDSAFRAGGGGEAAVATVPLSDDHVYALFERRRGTAVLLLGGYLPYADTARVAIDLVGATALVPVPAAELRAYGARRAAAVRRADGCRPLAVNLAAGTVGGVGLGATQTAVEAVLRCGAAPARVSETGSLTNGTAVHFTRQYAGNTAWTVGESSAVAMTPDVRGVSLAEAERALARVGRPAGPGLRATAYGCLRLDVNGAVGGIVTGLSMETQPCPPAPIVASGAATRLPVTTTRALSHRIDLRAGAPDAERDTDSTAWRTLLVPLRAGQTIVVGNFMEETSDLPLLRYELVAPSGTRTAGQRVAPDVYEGDAQAALWAGGQTGLVHTATESGVHRLRVRTPRRGAWPVTVETYPAALVTMVPVPLASMTRLQPDGTRGRRLAAAYRLRVSRGQPLDVTVAHGAATTLRLVPEEFVAAETERTVGDASGWRGFSGDDVVMRFADLTAGTYVLLVEVPESRTPAAASTESLAVTVRGVAAPARVRAEDVAAWNAQRRERLRTHATCPLPPVDLRAGTVGGLGADVTRDAALTSIPCGQPFPVRAAAAWSTGLRYYGRDHAWVVRAAFPGDVAPDPRGLTPDEAHALLGGAGTRVSATQRTMPYGCLSWEVDQASGRVEDVQMSRAACTP